MSAPSDTISATTHQKVAALLQQSKDGKISSEEAVYALVTLVIRASPDFFTPCSPLLQAHLQRLHDIYRADLLEIDDACEDIAEIIDASLRNNPEGLAWLRA